MEQQLLAILDSEENKKYYRYLLLDALTTVSEMDFIALNNIQDILGEDAITTVERTDLIYDLDSCPKLITIGIPNQELEKRLLHFSVVEAEDSLLEKKRYVSGWMISEYPPDVIAKQIASIGDFLGDFLGTKFVPFYEPFRMQLLHEGNAICYEFIADLLKSFFVYCYPTTKNKIATIQRLDYTPEKINIFISEDAKFYQKEALTIFNLYVAQCHIYQKLGKNILNINLMEIAQAYHVAYLSGLQTMEDRFVFSSMTIKYGDLMSNPVIKQAIEKAKNSECKLSQLFNEINKEEFIAINNSYMNGE